MHTSLFWKEHEEEVKYVNAHTHTDTQKKVNKSKIQDRSITCYLIKVMNVWS